MPGTAGVPDGSAARGPPPSSQLSSSSSPRQPPPPPLSNAVTAIHKSAQAGDPLMATLSRMLTSVTAQASKVRRGTDEFKRWSTELGGFFETAIGALGDIERSTQRLAAEGSEGTAPTRRSGPSSSSSSSVAPASASRSRHAITRSSFVKDVTAHIAESSALDALLIEQVAKAALANEVQRECRKSDQITAGAVSTAGRRSGSAQVAGEAARRSGGRPSGQSSATPGPTRGSVGAKRLREAAAPGDETHARSPLPPMSPFTQRGGGGGGHASDLSHGNANAAHLLASTPLKQPSTANFGSLPHSAGSGSGEAGMATPFARGAATSLAKAGGACPSPLAPSGGGASTATAASTPPLPLHHGRVPVMGGLSLSHRLNAAAAAAARSDSGGQLGSAGAAAAAAGGDVVASDSAALPAGAARRSGIQAFAAGGHHGAVSSDWHRLRLQPWILQQPYNYGVTMRRAAIDKPGNVPMKVHPTLDMCSEEADSRDVLRMWWEKNRRELLLKRQAEAEVVHSAVPRSHAAPAAAASGVEGVTPGEKAAPKAPTGAATSPAKRGEPAPPAISPFLGPCASQPNLFLHKPGGSERDTDSRLLTSIVHYGVVWFEQLKLPSAKLASPPLNPSALAAATAAKPPPKSTPNTAGASAAAHLSPQQQQQRAPPSSVPLPRGLQSPLAGGGSSARRRKGRKPGAP